MTTQRGNMYGFERAFVWRVNDSGIATGQLDPDSPGSAPQTSSAYEIYGPMVSQLPGANFGTHEFRGGGSFEGQADGGLENLDEGEMQSSQVDAALAALFMGTSLDTSTIDGGPIIWSSDDLNPSPVQVGLLLQRRIQSRVTASAGQNKYASILYPLVQMRLIQTGPSQEAGQNTQAATLSIKPQVATKFPWGAAFGSNQGWYNNSNIWFGINSEYPWHLTAFLQDGVETDVTLPYLPIYSTVTNGNTNVIHAINGTPTAPTSISTSTGVVVAAAAGTADLWRTIFYQTSFNTA